MNSSNPGVFIFLTVMVLGVVAILVLALSIEKYIKFFESIRWLVRSVKYTLAGAGISAGIYGIYMACSAIATAASGTDPMIFGYIIGGYAAFTVLGWVASKVYARLKENHAMYKKLREDKQIHTESSQA